MSVLNSSLKKAALYARYSSDMQTENSIEAQKMAIYRFANNNGYELLRNTSTERSRVCQQKGVPSSSA